MNSIIVMTRKQLYTEIWELSVAGVARKYNLNYSRLIKQCREENIPFPSSGYWTRKNMGKDVSTEVVILNGDPDKKLSVLTKDATVTRFKKTGTEKNNIQNKNTSYVILEEKNPVETIEVDNIEKKVDTAEREQCSDANIPDDFLPFLEEGEKNEVWDIIRKIPINDNVRLHKRLPLMITVFMSFLQLSL